MTDTQLNTTAPAQPTPGRILIVDDDPIAAGMLGVSLETAGHRISEAHTGEDALARIAELAADDMPEIIFLDIEMGMGIDGYETCRRLKADDATRDLPVIFLSGHDELEDRLRAYDAGGDDFLAKPFVPDEVLRKTEAALRHRRRLLATAGDSRQSVATALTALTNMGESGVTLKFSRGALGCRTQPRLANLVIESVRSFGITCHVQIRVPGETLTLTPCGPASPLEESVFEKMSSIDRIFSFRNRTIINYDSISILVMDMPVADEEMCGRIRDHVVMIAEAAELAVDNIHLRTETVRRAEALRELTGASRSAIEALRTTYRYLQYATRLELESMANRVEKLYVHLGLTDEQEFAVSDTVRGAVDSVLTMFELSSELDTNFANIVKDLAKAGEFAPLKVEEEVLQAVELW